MDRILDDQGTIYIPSTTDPRAARIEVLGCLRIVYILLRKDAEYYLRAWGLIGSVAMN